jgi:hypothetical protein
MELYPFSTYLLVFVAATVMLCALAVWAIKWRRSPLFRRKSLWKAVDYCWIALAVVSLLILVNSLVTKNYELRVAELNSDIEAIKGLQTYKHSELMKSQLCSENENEIDVEILFPSKKRFQVCPWLSFHQAGSFADMGFAVE